ncbi:hypothetical protein NFI96_025769 [Prochilodus magdalenae]|nr:hypothetical protein NFI96_025769 [Prochilodus magdalenae]
MMFLCVMLLIFSGFMDTISVNFTVVGPAAPLVVEAGKDLVLPCSLQPRISAVDMMVEWIRTDQSESINVVHLYEDYKDRIYEQMESYKGRTALFKDEMLRGNTSLKLSAVQPSDEGAYKCVIQYRSWNGAIPVYVEVIGSALQSQTCPLKELDLSKNNLQDAGMKTLSAGLENPQCKLEILRLAICNFTMESCKSLISALQTKCFLKELDLCNNELQDSVGELLSAGLKTGKWKLEILRLSGCMITEEGCYSLAFALTSNPSHLKELDLTYNHPEALGVKPLTARRKDPWYSLNTLRMEHGGEIRIKPGLKKYHCELTLDPNTAHRYLSLSDGNRKVKRVGSSQSDPDHPERFNHYEQVLSRESLTERCYWEAEWSGDVDIAVTYESISRKGRSADCVYGQNEKSWILFCSKSSYSVCHNNIRTASSAHPSSSRKVGVYVDCPAGTLSFYSISSDTHTLTRLHTFYTTFTEPLCAGFRLYNYNTSVHMCETE